MILSHSHRGATLRLTGIGALLIALLVSIVGFATPVRAASPNVVISQIYGGGGNTGATLRNDFIELFNRGTTAVDLTGWSVQYASATGVNWAKTDLAGSIAPGQYYLVQQAQGAGGTTGLPTPNATGTIAISATSGKVALVNNTTLITAGTSCPSGAPIIDFVGFGAANCSETAPTGALNNTTAALRNNGGCDETDNNAADFTVGAPAPRNSASPLNSCGVTPPPTPNLSINDVALAEGDGGATLFSFTVSLSAAAGAGGVTFDIATADGTATAGDADYLANGLIGQAIAEGATSSSFDVAVNGDTTIEATETFFVNITNVVGANLLDGQGQGTIQNDDVAPVPCSAVDTPISAIQGTGNSIVPAFNNQIVTVQGVVVGDYEGPSGIQGFYLQDAGDGNPASSDGIFVYNGSRDNVQAGQVVQVTGQALDQFNETRIGRQPGNNNNPTEILPQTIESCGTTGSVSPTPVEFPLTATNFLERFEGMLITLPQSLVISEYFNYDRFGEYTLARPLPGESRPYIPTSIELPGSPEYQSRLSLNQRSRILIDDGSNISNSPTGNILPNGEPFTLATRFRGGDTVTGYTGVLGFGFSSYRVQPATYGTLNRLSTPPTAPEAIGGTLRVAAFNTLNYFLTLDELDDDNTDVATDNNCGPVTNRQDCRGADLSQSQELQRQRAKLLATLAGLDADVIGLIELENTPGVEPMADIVAGLPGYSYVDTGAIGSDAIKVGIIYRTANVRLVGDYAVLDTQAFVNPRGAIQDRNRPALAQTFEEKATGGRFTVVVNHLKSKGSGCGSGDDSSTQGNCTLTRTLAARELARWLGTDPTGSGDADVLIVGDLNSYAKEDPIRELENVGYTNLIAAFAGPLAYSYLFGAEFGYLDYAMANGALTPQVAGVTEWHINSDEADLIDYDTSFKSDVQDSYYAPDAFRTADHDPVIVGLNLTNVAPVAADDSFSVAEDGSLSGNLLDNDSDVDSPRSLLAATVEAEPANGTLQLNADGTFTYTPNANYNGSDSFTYTVSDGYGSSAPATVTIEVTAVNDAPTGVADTATTTRSTAVFLDVLANDFDIDGDALTIVAVTQGANGSVRIVDGQIRYGPKSYFRGTDSFTYTISDGTTTVTVTVTVTVNK